MLIILKVYARLTASSRVNNRPAVVFGHVYVGHNFYLHYLSRRSYPVRLPARDFHVKKMAQCSSRTIKPSSVSSWVFEIPIRQACPRRPLAPGVFLSFGPLKIQFSGKTNTISCVFKASRVHNIKLDWIHRINQLCYWCSSDCHIPQLVTSSTGLGVDPKRGPLVSPLILAKNVKFLKLRVSYGEVLQTLDSSRLWFLKS